jgi:glycosyltransferase involved in cell wall biosynthesis
VRRTLGRLGVRDLCRLDDELDGFPPPRRLLVQWVPHAFGWRSLNLPFCAWLWHRAARRGDSVEVMFHEAFLAFEGTWRQHGAAAVHRLMTVLLLRAARRVWVSAPALAALLRRYSLGRDLGFRWLPIPSGVPVVHDASAVGAVRAECAGPGGLVGHFGTYGQLIVGLLEPALRALLATRPDVRILLLGRGGREFRASFLSGDAHHATRVLARGALEPQALSCALQACDVLLQPYPDGVTTRRTTAMAALAHGVPLVTTRGEVTEPLWALGGAAALVAPAPGDLADAVGRLLDDEGRREALGASGRALYESQFTLAHVVGTLRGG